MEKYKQHTKEGKKLCKYYKHANFLKLLQINPKKNNIVSYFIKDITDPIELKQYRQIKNKLNKEIIIMKNNVSLFFINRNRIYNYIVSIFKNRNKHIIKNKNITIQKNDKMQIINILISNIQINNLYTNSNKLNTINNITICHFEYTLFYIDNIRYKNMIKFKFIDKKACIILCYKYYNSKIYVNKHLYFNIIKYVQNIIIIQNKYELHFYGKLFSYLVFSM